MSQTHAGLCCLDRRFNDGVHVYIVASKHRSAASSRLSTLTGKDITMEDITMDAGPWRKGQEASYTVPEGTGPTKAVAGCSTSKHEAVKRAGPTCIALHITPVVSC